MHLLTLLPLLLPLVASEPVPLPRLTSLSHSGNGCPSDTDTVHREGKINVLSFTFDELSASPGSNSNCQVHFGVGGGAGGWQAGLSKIVVTDAVQEFWGGEVEVWFTAFWTQDATYTKTARTVVSSPVESVVLDFGDDMVWSPCSGGSEGYTGIFNGNLRVLSSDGAFFGSRGDSKTKEKYEWVWRRC